MVKTIAQIVETTVGQNIDASQGWAQSFQVVNSCKLTTLTLPMRKYGTPTGTFHWDIYAMTGSYGTTSKPTGSALATSDTVNVSVLTTTPTDVVLNFSGANQLNMVAGEYYCLVCTYSATTWPNAIGCVGGTVSGYGGNSAYLSGGVWTAYAQDTCFLLEGFVNAIVGGAFLLGLI